VVLGFTEFLTEIRIKNMKIMFLGSKVRPVRRADDLAAICDPTVWTTLHSYRPPQSVTGIRIR
jgi:hypothetical protein